MASSSVCLLQCLDIQAIHVSLRIRLGVPEIFRSSSTSSRRAYPRSRLPRPPSWKHEVGGPVHDAHDSRDAVSEVVRLQRVDDRDDETLRVTSGTALKVAIKAYSTARPIVLCSL